jgi:hypothetical protein
MVHVKFDPSSISINQFPNYYATTTTVNQEGGSIDYNYFHGAKPFQRGFGYYQNGAGLSDFLRTLWRAFLPVMKSAGHSLGTEAISTGSRVLNKVLEGENVKESLKKEGLKGVDNLLEKGGVGRQYGTGTIKKLKTHKNQFILAKRLIGKSVKFSTPTSSPPKKFTRKRNRSDAFGLY